MTNKTKLAIISDFHMDVNAFSQEELEIFNHLLIDQGIRHLHFAGDTSNDLKKITLPYFEELSELTGISVTYNLGNHDMVGLTEAEIIENDWQIQWFGDTAFLSFAGWYDYSLMRQSMPVEKLENFKKNFYFDRKIHRRDDDRMTTEKILTRLEQVLHELSSAKRVIISMHFVPQAQFVINTRYEKFKKFNAFLGSAHFHELFTHFPNVTDVVFGHIHHHFDAVKRDNIAYHTRPLGYPYEWQMVSSFFDAFPDYRIPEMGHLRKRYKNIRQSDDWLSYRKAHLVEEFLSALTIFEF